MKETIEKGDMVDVFFAGNDEAGLPDCEVLYTPCATGDSWRLRDKFSNLIYLQSFEMMRLKRKQGTSKLTPKDIKPQEANMI